MARKITRRSLLQTGTGLSTLFTTQGLKKVRGQERTPRSLWKEVTGKNWGYEASGLKKYHEFTGYYGEDRDILVIDSGFDKDLIVFNPVYEGNDHKPYHVNVHSVLTTSHSSINTRFGGHGNLVTSVVWQAAPNARYHIAKISTREDMINSLQHAANSDIYDVVVTSHASKLYNLSIVDLLKTQYHTPLENYVKPIEKLEAFHRKSDLIDAANDVYNNDIVFVASAGNGNLIDIDIFPEPPATAENAIAVASTAKNNMGIYSGGSPGLRWRDKPDLAAPGEEIAMLPYYDSGSSYAAPHVAGIALLLSEHGSPTDVKNAIENTAIDIPDTNLDGHGRVSMMDAYRALTNENEQEENGGSDDNEQDEEIEDGPFERLSPDPEITVQPETTVLFEVGINDSSISEIELSQNWTVDGEQKANNNAPWLSHFYSRYNAIYYQHTFQSEGEHEVSLQHPANDSTISWSIEVASNGTAPPSINNTSLSPDENLEIDSQGNLAQDLELEISDPDGDLDRVLWWVSVADQIHDETDINGSEDTASFTPGEQYTDMGGVSAWVIDENGAITTRGEWVFADSEGENNPDYTVQPETRILLETGVPNDINTHNVEWSVNNDNPSEVIFLQGYRSHTGNAAQITDFNTTGTYQVVANHPDGSELDTWTISVTNDGASPVVIEEMNTEPGEDETVESDQPVEITVSARDPESKLEMVLWQEGENRVDITDTSSISGTTDTATLGLDSPQWISTGAPTVAAVLTEDRRISDIEEDEGPSVLPPFEIVSVEATTQNSSNRELEVVAEVRNQAGTNDIGKAEKEIQLEVDNETVGSKNIELDRSESTTVTWQTPVERDDPNDIEVRVSSPTSEDSTTVTIEEEETGDEETDEPVEPATFEVADMQSNSPVSGGETLEVDTTIENVGDETGTTDVELIVGHSPSVEDSEMLTLDPGESTNLTLTFQTGQPSGETEEFPIEVDTGADTASVTVTVQ